MSIVLIILISIVVLLSLLLSVYDEGISVIPNVINLIMLGVALTYYFIDLKNGSWWMPLASSLGLFLIFFILFCLTGENAMGGGDMKLVCVSLLFFNTWDKMYCYLILFCIYTLIAYLRAKIKKERTMRMGQYLALPLIVALISNITKTIDLNFVIPFSLLFFMTVYVNSLIFFGGELLYEKVNKIFEISSRSSRN